MSLFPREPHKYTIWDKVIITYHGTIQALFTFERVPLNLSHCLVWFVERFSRHWKQTTDLIDLKFGE